MRLIFLGSGEFGLPTLKHLHASHEVAAVITQPDCPAGRKQHLTPTPIGQWASDAGLPVFKVENANVSAFVAQVAALKADSSIVIAFGQKLSLELIAALGPFVVNLHASLLPKYRGAAPINWAMIHGEKETGVSVIALAQKMDAGLVYATVSTPIDPLETAGELHDRLALLGPAAIEGVLGQHQSNTLTPLSQDETQATRAPKLKKTDGILNFDARADQIRCRIHGLTPWPGVQVKWVQTATGKEQPLFLRRVRSEPGVSCGCAVPGTVIGEGRVAVREGSLLLLQVQTPGKRIMTFDEFSHGHVMKPGDVLKSD
ncbi:MAG: methionyl-tRNA formyltransferase [Phycisphaeraceae bacterium]